MFSLDNSIDILMIKNSKLSITRSCLCYGHHQDNGKYFLFRHKGRCDRYAVFNTVMTERNGAHHRENNNFTCVVLKEELYALNQISPFRVMAWHWAVDNPSHGSTITQLIDPHMHTRKATLIARFMGPTWGPSGTDRTQVGPILAPWTLLFGKAKRMSCGRDANLSLIYSIRMLDETCFVLCLKNSSFYDSQHHIFMVITNIWLIHR